MFKICGFHSVHVENFGLLGYGTVWRVKLPATQKQKRPTRPESHPKGSGGSQAVAPPPKKNRKFINTDYVYKII